MDLYRCQKFSELALYLEILHCVQISNSKMNSVNYPITISVTKLNVDTRSQEESINFVLRVKKMPGQIRFFIFKICSR